MCRTPFFFADEIDRASLYDTTISKVVPHYNLLHESMHIVIADYIERHERRMYTALDVGSGTGVDSIALVRNNNDLVVHSLDISSAIQQIHRLNLRRLSARPGLGDLLNRNHLLTADVREYFGRSRDLLRLLNAPGGLDFVVSALTVHHFTSDDKRAFYQLAHDLLVPGGMLINGDLFSNSSESISRAMLQYDLEWINRYLARKPKLRDHWIEHYVEDNRCEPLLPSQIEMLRDIQFMDVDMVYRFSMSGVLIGFKP